LCLKGILTLDKIRDRHFNKGGRPRRIHPNRRGKACLAKVSRVGKLLKRHKVSKGRTTANLVSLKAREALTQGLLPLQKALL
jgi:hypothetical protein